MPGIFDNLNSGVSAGGGKGWLRPWQLMLRQFLYSSSARNRSAPHIRDSSSVQAILNNFVIASIPCWLIGLWNLGYQSNLAMVELGLTTLPGWRGAILSGLGIGHDPENMFACFAHGFLYFLPIFLVALLVSAFWNAIFSRLRRRELDEGLLLSAWLFALILPAGAPLYQVGFGMSFGLVMGKHIFGGSGRYLVNPAVLGLAFLWLAYPDLVFAGSNWVPVPGFERVLPLELAAAGGIEAILVSGLSWWDLFLGARPGPIGMTSVLGSILAAAYLVITGTASWRVMTAVLLAAVATVFVFNSVTTDIYILFAVPWEWQLLLGSFAFGTVFLATDPVAGAMTNSGRWVFGALVGVLAILIQVANPAFSEAILFAVFLASLFAPILDFVVVELYVRRRRRRIRELVDG